MPNEQSIQSKIANVNLDLGRLELQTGNIEEAVRLYKEAISSARNKKEVPIIAAEIKRQVQEYRQNLPENEWEKSEAALRMICEKVLSEDREIRAQWADHWRRWGDALKKEGKTELSNRAYERAEEIARQQKRWKKSTIKKLYWWIGIPAVIIVLTFCAVASYKIIQRALSQPTPTPTPTQTTSVPTLTNTLIPTSSHTPTPTVTLTFTPVPTPTVPPTKVTPTVETTMPASPTLTITPTPTLLVPTPGSQIKWGKDNSTLVYFPDANDVDSFWIDLHLVTNEQFQQFVNEIEYETLAEKLTYGWAWNPVEFKKLWGGNWQQPQGTGSSIQDLAQHPVILINWEEADAYCRWAEKRLPTKKEWELAARGTDGRLYPWGNQEPNSQYLNYCDIQCPWTETQDDDGYGRTSPVCAFPAGNSLYGLCDMAGNVWQWINDWDIPDDKRIICGGAWSHQPEDAGKCVGQEPEIPLNVIGFRCARDADFDLVEQNGTPIPATE